MKYLYRKSLIVIILCFTVYPVLSVENLLQQDDENLIRTVVDSPVGRLSRHHACLKTDYISYKIQSGKTVYSQILELEDKYKKEQDGINFKYIKKLKDLYMFVACYDDENSMNAEFLREFNAAKIIIADDEYRILDKDLRILLSVVNVFN